MIGRISRWLALILTIAAVLHDWPSGRRMFLGAFVCGTACFVIWFPEFIDELTFGMTRAGKKIDAHTPAWLIASVGWVLLGLHLLARFSPGWLSRAFGM
jgi:hypothetical protein